MIYSNPCCDMIAVKREVAVLSSETGFPWSECQETFKVRQSDDKSLYKQYVCELLRAETTCEKTLDEFESMTHTGECTVTACRTYLIKVRKGGDFFYGKSGNENYS